MHHWSDVRHCNIEIQSSFLLCLTSLRSGPHHLTHIVCLSSKLGQTAGLFTIVEEHARSVSDIFPEESRLKTYIGSGAHASARKAVRVAAQLIPRLWYIGETKSGNLPCQHDPNLIVIMWLTRHRTVIAIPSWQPRPTPRREDTNR